MASGVNELFFHQLTRAAVRAMVEGEILCNRYRAASEAAKNE